MWSSLVLAFGKIYLKEQSRGREMFHPLVHSADDHSSEVWVRPKPGTWSSIWVSCVGGTPTLGQSAAFSQVHLQGAQLEAQQPELKLMLCVGMQVSWAAAYSPASASFPAILLPPRGIHKETSGPPPQHLVISLLMVMSSYWPHQRHSSWP